MDVGISSYACWRKIDTRIYSFIYLSQLLKMTWTVRQDSYSKYYQDNYSKYYHLSLFRNINSANDDIVDVKAILENKILKRDTSLRYTDSLKKIIKLLTNSRSARYAYLHKLKSHMSLRVKHKFNVSIFPVFRSKSVLIAIWSIIRRWWCSCEASSGKLWWTRRMARFHSR